MLPLQLYAISSGCYFINLGRYPMFLFLLVVVSLQLVITSTESQDTQGKAVLFNFEDLIPKKTTWTYAGQLEVLYPKTIDDVGEKFQIYFSRISDKAKKMSHIHSIIRRLIIVVANALEGKVIYTMLLPRITGLYCDGHATFTTLKFVHDVERIIMQILRDTGRGWGKLAVSGLQRSAVASAVRPANEQASKSMSSYGNTDPVPFQNFDINSRSHLLMVSWRTGWPVLVATSWTPAVVTKRHFTVSRRPRRSTCANKRPGEAVLPVVTARDMFLKETVDDGGRGHYRLDCDRKTSSDASSVTFFTAIVMAPLSVYWALTS